jgi:hypothetical protein
MDVCSLMTDVLALSQTLSLLIDAMRRPVRRRRSVATRLARIGLDGEFAGGGDSRKRGGGGTPQNLHNNYVAQPDRAPSPRGGKVGAPFGNRNAAKRFTPEFVAWKARADDLIARMKAAIAAAEREIAARPRPRRIDCIIRVRDGVVMRVSARGAQTERPGRAGHCRIWGGFFAGWPKPPGNAPCSGPSPSRISWIPPVKRLDGMLAELYGRGSPLDP